MSYPKILALLFVASAINLPGCGGNGDGGPPPTFTTQISSDPAFDGDIDQAAPDTYLVTQGMSPSVQSVFAGIDPATLTEYRTFLDFPLTGAGGVPGNAVIESAFLDVYINSLQPATAAVPLRIELVYFQPPTLIGTDFDRGIQPAIGFLQVNPAFTLSDVGTNVSIDVTDLMVQAQQQALLDFQVRILEDLGPAIVGLIEINDSTGGDRSMHAPQLSVTYH
jgi:hypothetical protein